MVIKRIVLFCLSVISLTLAQGPADAGEDIAISAGTKGGPFYRTGHAICRLLNRAADDMSCSVMPMPAGDAAESFASIVNLRDAATEIGIARSDWVHFAYRGTGPVRYMHSKFDFIRGLFAIDVRPLSVLAKRKSGIHELADLKGRRVNLGRPHSEARASMDLILGAKGWTRNDFVLAEELAPAEQSFSFCQGRVEAVYYLAMHPSTVVRRLMKLCDAALIDVSGPEIQRLVAEHPYLTATTIPGGIYEQAPEPVNTFGTTVMVVSSVDMPQDLIYTVVKTIFENLQALRRIHPGLHYLEPAQMVKGALAAPLHEGARRYFRERGWL